MESDNSSMDSRLCSNGCGFHGPLKNHNLCSKCFEEHEKAAVAKPTEEPLNPSSSPPKNQSSPLKFTNSSPRFSFSSNSTTTFSGFGSSFGPSLRPSNLDSSSLFGVSSKTKRFSFAGNKTSVDSNRRISVNTFSFGASNPKKTVKNRCIICKKRVGLTGFECRCGNLFCGKHRYPEEHSCNFDYKKFGRDLLLKQNPVCKADKLRD